MNIFQAPPTFDAIKGKIAAAMWIVLAGANAILFRGTVSVATPRGCSVAETGDCGSDSPHLRALRIAFWIIVVVAALLQKWVIVDFKVMAKLGATSMYVY